MLTLARKWRAVFSVYFQDGIAYRASGIIWITTDLVTAVTMPVLWTAAASGGTIAGYTVSDFVLYYLCMLLIGSFVTSHILFEIATEIREGQFSTQLVRPISFYQLSYLRNLPWRIIRTCLFLPFFFVLIWVYRGYLDGVQLYFGWELWVSILLGHLVSFFIVMMLSMIALFTQEAFSIFELYYIPLMFLSGQLFPVALLPQWALNLAKIMPFYYTTGAPTEILIGRLTGPAMHQAIGVQFTWVILAFVIGKIGWTIGLRHYTAVGM
ncbi:MAG: ABC transporter permease [Fimbriimonadaceae bacterium]